MQRERMWPEGLSWQSPWAVAGRNDFYGCHAHLSWPSCPIHKCTPVYVWILKKSLGQTKMQWIPPKQPNTVRRESLSFFTSSAEQWVVMGPGLWVTKSEQQPKWMTGSGQSTKLWMTGKDNRDSIWGWTLRTTRQMQRGKDEAGWEPRVLRGHDAEQILNRQPGLGGIYVANKLHFQGQALF